MRRRTRLLLSLTMMGVIALLVTVTVGQDLMANRRPDLDSFALIHFAGYLFFIVMPVEVLIPWYQAEGHAGYVLLGLAVGTAFAAQCIDFAIGWALSGDVIHTLIGERRHRRTHAAIEKHGVWAIFLFNFLPLSSPILLLVAGMVRFSPWVALPVSLAGLTGKYLLLVYVGSLFFLS
ncbi:MAG: VTT domain-containing protein [Gemmatimonadota bacterium]